MFFFLLKKGERINIWGHTCIYVITHNKQHHIIKHLQHASFTHTDYIEK